jgi:hypothetical protein
MKNEFNFLIALPVVGQSNVKEAGEYLATLNQESVALCTDRQDMGNNPKLAAKEGDFVAPWSDPTPQIYIRFKTKDGRTITDRFQLRGFEHYDDANKPTAKIKEAWMKELKAKGYDVASFKAFPHRDTNYICAILKDKSIVRIENAENTNKSLLRLATMLNHAGIVCKGNSPVAIVEEIKTSTVNNEIKVVLEDKLFEGERRSASKLFKISYRSTTEKVNVATPVDAGTEI